MYWYITFPKFLPIYGYAQSIYIIPYNIQYTIHKIRYTIYDIHFILVTVQLLIFRRLNGLWNQLGDFLAGIALRIP
jgi:hypothetical protein